MVQGILEGVVWPLVGQVLLLLLGAVVLPLAAWVTATLVGILRVKLKITLNEERQKQIYNVVLTAIRAVEEMTRDRAEAYLGKKGSTEKLDIALGMVEERLSSMGIKVSKDEAIETIHAALDEMRGNGNGGGTDNLGE